jgi:hypothetical protein
LLRQKQPNPLVENEQMVQVEPDQVSICTTRIVAGVGFSTLSAVLEVVAALC